LPGRAGAAATRRQPGWPGSREWGRRRPRRRGGRCPAPRHGDVGPAGATAVARPRGTALVRASGIGEQRYCRAITAGPLPPRRGHGRRGPAGPRGRN